MNEHTPYGDPEKWLGMTGRAGALCVNGEDFVVFQLLQRDETEEPTACIIPLQLWDAVKVSADKAAEPARRRSVWHRCHADWKRQTDKCFLDDFDHERIYMSGGMWMHPCGETFQEGGKDGFKDSLGDEYCQCELCRDFRREFVNE